MDEAAPGRAKPHGWKWLFAAVLLAALLWSGAGWVAADDPPADGPVGAPVPPEPISIRIARHAPPTQGAVREPASLRPGTSRRQRSRIILPLSI